MKNISSFFFWTLITLLSACNAKPTYPTLITTDYKHATFSGELNNSAWRGNCLFYIVEDRISIEFISEYEPSVARILVVNCRLSLGRHEVSAFYVDTLSSYYNGFRIYSIDNAIGRWDVDESISTNEIFIDSISSDSTFIVGSLNLTLKDTEISNIWKNLDDKDLKTELMLRNIRFSGFIFGKTTY